MFKQLGGIHTIEDINILKLLIFLIFHRNHNVKCLNSQQRKDTFFLYKKKILLFDFIMFLFCLYAY